MICIVLVAGHGTLLETEIKDSSEYSHLAGVPKALLPGVGGKRILDYWWEALKTRKLFNDVYLVTNADKYKYFERWATASDFPVENIINDGSTTFTSRIGALADLDLAVTTKRVKDDVLVVAGDMLFQDTNFDIAQVVNYFHLKKDGDLAIYYEMLPEENISSRGIVEVLPSNSRIVRFLEKPKTSATESRLASVVFYCLKRETLSMVQDYLTEFPDVKQRACGYFMEWLINKKERLVYGMKLPTGFQLIGHVGLDDYRRWLDFFAKSQETIARHRPVVKRAYARVGLMGNPSDGFHGKTIALSISNFWAEVSLVESEKLTLIPHPLNDPTEFGSLIDLHGISRKEGYLGGLRLLQATCKKFYQFCSERGIALVKRNFTLKYDTNIPRQVGLAGSSAIVTATLQCLMAFFNLTHHDIALELQPQFILDVEMQELFIQAGLQDRVIQVYEGLVYMDFSKELFDKQGYGSYLRMSVADLPRLWVAFLSDPSDSGKIHSNFSERWRKGEEEAVNAVTRFAQLTDQAKAAIETEDWASLAKLMNENFDLRRKVYGDAALGQANLMMVELARAHGAAVKFPGSGGAVVGLSLDTTKLAEMKKAFQAEGFVICDIIPNLGGKNHDP